MGATDQVQIVFFAEDLDVVWSEGEGDSSLVLSPALRVLIWVRPQQVTEQS